MSDTAPESVLPPAESGVEADDLNTTTIVVVGLISTALVLASALGVKALYSAYINIDSAKKALVATASEADSLVQQQDSSLLGAPHEIAGQPGVYSMRIDDAMKLVVKELSAEQSQGQEGQ
ncbi:hypothetical protein KOR34_19010 [Posidoniimonas corsicana]|uniref:Uncharacterized protein n=1 Tax=Posidoniimonas corsicana TaxID=1938618 RepID=A0A5C5VEA3_9BACT|nr:hypothetical protein [Posidoniimonas corsicana]TWT36956.1 hypothetical protein KOR34_19010 [Posidoniimonas corsicana]